VNHFDHEKEAKTRKFFGKLARELIHIPNTNDEKEEFLRLLSPADMKREYVPQLPDSLQISRLNGDGVEFVPDYISKGLADRQSTRQEFFAAKMAKLEREMEDELKLQDEL
jgi:hypothetical protein